MNDGEATCGPAGRPIPLSARAVADIAVHYALFLGRTLGLDERYKPNCRAYLERLMQREGFQRAMARQEEVTAQSE